MTPTHVPERFARTMACTAQELLGWLPRALPEAQLEQAADGRGCTARWPEGSLTLQWQTLPERRIALLRMPQLQVDFAWDGLDAQQRYRRQRFFDLSTQRGGG